MNHHAYLLLGEKEAGESYLESVFSDLGISPTANPDVWFVETDVFGVDDARKLSEDAQAKAFGSKKVFILDASRFTPEAQNALLKIFEEPPVNTHFFVFAHNENMFLPTLLSRMQTVRLERVKENDKEAENFLHLSLAKRIIFARKFADEKEERGTGALASFIDSLLLLLKNSNASLANLEKVFKIRLFAEDSSAMSRLIIEHLALVLE
jgi:replication-associated recombination protein RarA